jgi:hypothetical protein
MKRNTRLAAVGIALASLSLGQVGCAGPSKVSQSAAKPSAAAPPQLSGKVTETMDSGGYTYLCLEKDGAKTWVALPTTKVTVGQEMKLLPGAQMSNFSSKTLNRTFDKIIFSGGVEQGGPSAAKPAPAMVSPYKESEEPILKGKVVETASVAQYTYVNLEKDGKTAWSAVPVAEVSVGDEVEMLPGTVMGRFTSKTLNKTFNSIYFASGLTITKHKEGAVKAAGAKVADLKAADPKAAEPKAAEPKAAEPKAADARAVEAAGAVPVLPAGHPKIDLPAQSVAAAPAAEAQEPITGEVVETADAGGYTYVCLKKDGKKTWAAIPPMKVEVGQQLALAPGLVMPNFVSRGLNRTFDNIVFSSGPVPK